MKLCSPLSRVPRTELARVRNEPGLTNEPRRRVVREKQRSNAYVELWGFPPVAIRCQCVMRARNMHRDPFLPLVCRPLILRNVYIILGNLYLHRFSSLSRECCRAWFTTIPVLENWNGNEWDPRFRNEYCWILFWYLVGCLTKAMDGSSNGIIKIEVAKLSYSRLATVMKIDNMGDGNIVPCIWMSKSLL